jgi:hypothetical protein
MVRVGFEPYETIAFHFVCEPLHGLSGESQFLCDVRDGLRYA